MRRATDVTTRGIAGPFTARSTAHFTAVGCREQLRRSPSIRNVFALAPVLLQKLSQSRVPVVSKPLTVIRLFVVPYTYNSRTALAKRRHVHVDNRAGSGVVRLYIGSEQNCKNRIRQ